MKWELLRQRRCPHCEDSLYENQYEKIFECMSCRFNIDQARFVAISRARGGYKSGSDHVRIQWQYILEDKCPICKDILHVPAGRQEFRKCISPECTFFIKEETVQMILGDPNHPAYKFKKQN